MLTDETYLDLVRDQAALLAETPLEVLGQRVPGCPDWDVAQLIGHTGWIHRWVTAILANGGQRISAKTVPQAPEDQAAATAWFAEGVEPLLAALRDLDPTAEAFTFVGPRPAGWWRRRMAHETTVHRWDAESAYRAPAPFAPDVAVDGIEEVWDVYFPNRFGFGQLPTGTTVHLHATDTTGEWLVTLGADAETSRVERGHAKGDVAIRGAASDLLLYCFGRLSPDRLDVVGDLPLARAFQAAGRY
jgi:uncharacterized protein (TIGR03083 family)